MRNKDIGLVVWGCKGGYRVFCSQGVNVKEKSIADTIKDIRSFVRFNQVKLTTYALEFTEEYKVFTVYRSCNDSGVGAFVAITIYVPHNLKVLNIRTSLDVAIDSYFKEFVHPVFGTYLDGRYDSIGQYQSLLDGLEVIDDCKYDYRPSIQDDCPHLRLYDDISEVDSFFDSPYRKEFFVCQEVMFMSRNLYNSGADSLRFNFKENIIKHVSEPDTPPIIAVSKVPGIHYFDINGIEYSVTANPPVNVKDVVTIKLKKEFCEDFTILGRIDKLINQGLLVESNKTISVRVSNISWEYKKYDISFTLNGTYMPDNLIYIEDINSPIINQKIRIDGSVLRTQKKISLRPCCLDNTLTPIGKFVPADYINGVVDIRLKNHYFFIDIVQGVRSKEDIIIYPGSGFPSIKIPISSLKEKRIDIYLPEGFVLNDKSFDTSTGYTTIELVNNTLRLIPRELEYDLELPGEVKEHIKGWDFFINKESKKTKSIINREDYKVKIVPSDKIESGLLCINGYQYDYTIENNSIIPKIVYIRFNDSNCECQVKWLGKNIVLYDNIVLPFKADVKVDESRFSLVRTSKSATFTEITISRKTSNTITQQVSASSENNLKHKVILDNCRSFDYINKNGDVINITKKIEELNLTKKSFSLYNKNAERCCIIYNSESDYTYEIKKFNEQNGFSVSYEGNCIKVTYLKKHIFPPIPPIPKKTILFGFLGVFVILSCIFLYHMFNSDKTPALNICFNIPNNEFYKKITKIELSSENDYVTTIQDSVVIKWDNRYKENYNSIVSLDIILCFEDQSKKSLSLSDSSSHDILKYLNSFIDKKPIDYYHIIIPVITPLQELMAKVSEMETNSNDPESLFKGYSKILEQTKNKRFHTYILKKVAEKTLSKDTLQYDLYLQNFKKFETNDIYTEVKKRRESIKKQQQESARLACLNNTVTEKINLLHELNCDTNTVKSIKKWYEKLSEDEKNTITSISHFNFKNAIANYEAFFNANESHDITFLRRRYFSEEQWKIIHSGYGCSTERFNNWKKSIGMNFSKAKGIMN